MANNKDELFIFKNFDYTVSNLCKIMNIDENVDINYKTFNIAGKKLCIFFIDGMIKDEILQKILDFLCGLKDEELPDNTHDFISSMITYGETDYTILKDKFVTAVLSGNVGLIVEGYNEGILIDCRKYPARGVEEPLKDKVLRGSRDGFVETLVMNLALIRRRIRSTDFTCNILNVGEYSKTDIAICYMKNKADEKLVNRIKDNINNIKTDSLNMNQETLAECLLRVDNNNNSKNQKIRKIFNKLNPFPKFKYSERPDTAAASLMEGHIIILVDNSPAAMILPTDIFDIVDEADDYYFPPITGNYLRFARVIITIASFFLTPLYLLFSLNPELLPGWLDFTMIKDEINVPVLLQLLILEISIDGLKLAAVNTPEMLSTPLSVIAGLVIGDFAVSSGWFNSETMLYMAFVAFAAFTNGSFEMGYAIKLHRILTLFLVACFGIWGLIAGTLICIISICLNKTVSETSYIYPIIPLNLKELNKKIFRHSK